MTKENKKKSDKEGELFYLPNTFEMANCSGVVMLVVMFSISAIMFYWAITAHSITRLVFSLMFGVLTLGLFIWFAYLFIKSIIGKLKNKLHEQKQ
jgi:NADH:ubiquinone oxidoreductase subunit 3 (subunit A)